jgi:hypothetical protein
MVTKYNPCFKRLTNASSNTGNVLKMMKYVSKYIQS